MPHIEVSQESDDYLSFAASVSGQTKGQIVARLIEQARVADNGRGEGKQDAVPIHAFYDRQHVEAVYYRRGGRIEILNGSLAGRTFKTPSEAAREVVSHHNPDVTANRNGWTFWVITDTNAPLQSIRYDDI